MFTIHVGGFPPIFGNTHIKEFSSKQLKYCLECSARKIGEETTNLTNMIFQMGGFNHQLVSNWGAIF